MLVCSIALPILYETECDGNEVEKTRINLCTYIEGLIYKLVLINTIILKS